MELDESEKTICLSGNDKMVIRVARDIVTGKRTFLVQEEGEKEGLFQLSQFLTSDEISVGEYKLVFPL